MPTLETQTVVDAIPDPITDLAFSQQRLDNARDLIQIMGRLPGLVSTFESVEAINDLASKARPYIRGLGAGLVATLQAGIAVRITDNVNRQNALRGLFGLSPINTLGAALQYGGYGGASLEPLRSDQAIVRQRAGL